MKKLKILLLFSLLIYILIYLNIPVKEINEYVDISGRVYEIKNKESYNSLVLKSKGKKYLVYYDNDIKLSENDKVMVRGNMRLPNSNRNFYLFNYRLYLRSKKIYYQIDAKDIKLESKDKSLFYKIKNKLISRMDNFKYKEYFRLFLYGENTLESDIYENYQKLGIVHLFCLSGMHIHFIVFILSKLFRKNKDKKIVIFLSLYLLFVNKSPSILRASLMEMVFLLSNKKISKKDICIILLILFLFYNPYYLYSTGFLFTFIITLTLIHFKFKKWVIPFITFLVSIPILINNSFDLNLLEPLYNILSIPYITFIIFPLTIITYLIPSLEPLLNSQIYLLETLTSTLANINTLTLSFPYLNIIGFTFLYLLIFISLKKKNIILVIIFLLIHYNIHNFKINTTITMFDVGQGDSILIDNKDYTYLIDTGGQVYKDISKDIILSLKARGIKKIDYLILSHGDFDHMGSSINLVNNFKVENVIFNNDNFNDLEKELINTLNKKNIKYYKDVSKINSNLYFLNTKKYDNENDNSNVLYFKLNNYKFLFMGDSKETKEKDILDKYKLEDIDFIKIGHHGSNTSSSKYFIDNIKPKNCLISVGKNNRYGHPKEEVLNTLNNYCNIYRTDLNGSIEVSIFKDKYKIKTIKEDK